jgi:CheY-like chemotaxis protein
MDKRPKVLLVEDSKIVQQLYKNALTLEQFEVRTVDNGMEAIKALSGEKPDIILLDLMMPVMDGYKVLQVVKTDPKLSMIPVLVFSSKGQPEEVEKSLALGATGYIVKATTKPKEVIEKIKTILNQRPPARELIRYTIEIREDTYDAKKLSFDFALDNFRCPVCQTTMLLELIPEPEFSKDAPWFSGKFICPECNK